MFFRKLTLRNFPPFADQEILFPEVESSSEPLAEVHVITGINGTGKTRLLSVLAAVLGNSEHIAKRWPNPNGYVCVNNLALNSGSYNSILSVIRLTGQDYSSFAETLSFAYNGSAYIQNATIKPMEATKMPDVKSRLAFNRPSEQASSELLQNTANLKIKASLDAVNLSSSGNPISEQVNQSIPLRLIRNLELAIKEITGKEFRFDVKTYGKATICVCWGEEKDLEFSLLPDGLRSIIGWLVHAVVMLDACLEGKSDPTEYPAIFLIDEPESHLHPAWQRKVLPAFQKLFPKSQIIVSTHSPFVIASLNHGWIHRLIVDDSNRKVKVAKEKAKLGDSYMSVTEDLMDINPRQAFDTETEKLLTTFYTHRDAAYQNEKNAIDEAEKIAEQIKDRGPLLALMMDNEVAQMRRQLAVSKSEA